MDTLNCMRWSKKISMYTYYLFSDYEAAMSAF